jgi:hypothetical protein
LTLRANKDQNGIFKTHSKIIIIEQSSIPPFSLNSQEKRSLLLIFLLYLIEGLTIGFFLGSLPILLAERGVEYSQLGVLSFARLFLSTKPFFAPFVDTVPMFDFL